MPKMRITQAAVEKMRPPAEGRVEYWDSTLPGFGIRIAAAGRKTWQVFYRVNGKQVRETLGTLATVPEVAAARALARQSMQKAQAGINPAAERLAIERATLGAVLDRYLERHALKRMKPSYYTQTRRTFDVDIKPALGAKPIGDITRRDIRELLERIVDRGSPSHANHVLSYLRAALNWAVSNDIIERNPCDGLQKPSMPVERDRALTDDEIQAFWSGCDAVAHPFGPFFQLLLLTGQRRGELAGATWSEFDFDKAQWTIPAERVKNSKAHIVHLPPIVVDILTALPRIGDKGLVFTTTGDRPVAGFGDARYRLDRAMREAGAEVAPFTLHDLRRSAATGMASLGIAPHIVDRVLNHQAGKISGVAKVYNRYEYLDERKAALDAWSRHVAGLVGLSEQGNVVQFVAGR
jgi:integrase